MQVLRLQMDSRLFDFDPYVYAFYSETTQNGGGGKTESFRVVKMKLAKKSGKTRAVYNERQNYGEKYPQTCLRLHRQRQTSIGVGNGTSSRYHR